MRSQSISLDNYRSHDTNNLKWLQLDPALQRVLDWIRLKARCRIAWLDRIWAAEKEKAGHKSISAAEIETILDDKDSPQAEAQWLDENDELATIHSDLRQLEQVMADDDESRLAQFFRIFAIEQEDGDLFQACLAFEIDPSLSRLYAYLQDHPGRGYVTEELVRRLFGYGRHRICYSESPLRLWDLVREREVIAGEPTLFAVDPLLCDWLMGSSTLDPLLVGKAMLRTPLKPLQDWPVKEAVNLIKRHVNNESGNRIRIALSGLPGGGRHTLAAVIASKLGMTLVAIDSDRIEAEMWQQTYLHAQRQAFLDRTALCWNGAFCLDRAWPRQIIPFPVQFVVLEPGQTVPVHPDMIDHRLEMVPLSIDERYKLWKRSIPESVAWTAPDFERLVGQHRVTVGEIAAVAAKRISTVTEAEACIRESARYRLGELAQLVECPFSWDDLVLPERIGETLHDFLFEAGDRTAFWEHEKARRLFPQGRGLMALFSGPSGTGKTMSTQVIAAELGLDLFRIDLAAVVSKYVGETSKNLERILSRAQHMDVVLLFDEADALLGKRTEIRDAHDRFANTDTNYLLQALEDYQGIAILSSNKKNNIDNAFIRRIRYVVEFQRPDASQRLILWKRLIGELVGEEILTSTGADNRAQLQNIKTVANTIELTGAQIKYAVLAAMFAARREREKLGMKHLLRGIDRELMKEGRVLTERERKRLNSYELTTPTSHKQAGP